jgi:hypothetical protein
VLSGEGGRLNSWSRVTRIQQPGKIVVVISKAGHARYRHRLGVRAETTEVSQHLAWMGIDVRHSIALPDDAIGIDEIGPALRRPGAPFLRSSLRLIRLGDGPIRVGEEPERESVPFGEGAIGFGGVERDSQDLGACFLKRWGSITEPLALHPSPGGVRPHVPPQNHPAPPKILQGHEVPVLIRQAEAGGRNSLGEHGASMLSRHVGGRLQCLPSRCGRGDLDLVDVALDKDERSSHTVCEHEITMPPCGGTASD